MEFVLGLGEIIRQVVRIGVGLIVLILAVIAILDWMVRKYRVNAFHPLATFLRRTVAPILKPVERSVVRAGGLPTAAPLWTLAFAIIAGIVIITLTDMVIQQIASIWFGLRGGPRGIYLVLVRWTFSILQIAIIIRVLSSWVPISPYSRFMRLVYSLTEPILGPLRQFVPRLGFFDITPIIAFFLLRLLESVFMNFRI